MLLNWCSKVVLEQILRIPWITEIRPVNPKGNQSWIFIGIFWIFWCWSWNSNTLATWCKELTHLKRSSCCERLKVGGEGDNRGWDGWMALPTRGTWVWASSGSWWWTGKPSMLQSMGLQRVRHDWASELNCANKFYKLNWHQKIWLSNGNLHYAFIQKG